MGSFVDAHDLSDPDNTSVCGVPLDWLCPSHSVLVKINVESIN